MMNVDTSVPALRSIGYNQFTGTVPETLKRFTNMRFVAVKNQLTGLNNALCSQRDWFKGEVGEIIDKGGDDDGCDAILCRSGTYNAYGRARASNGGECKDCPGGKFAGQTSCDVEFDDATTATTLKKDDEIVEKKILDKLYFESGGPNWKKKDGTKPSGWMDGPICDYEGVVCESDGANEGVQELILAGFGLTANVTTAIYRLPSLKKVDFSGNVVDLSFDGIEHALYLEYIRMTDADLSSVNGVSRAPKLKTVSCFHSVALLSTACSM